MAKTKSKAKPPKKPKATPGTVIGEANGLPIRRLKVSEIDTATYNPREITEHALEGLKASVDTFHLVQPLVWNLRFTRLVGGHQRLKTLDPNSETDVIQVDLDEIDEKALNASLNNDKIQGAFTASLRDLIDSVESARPELFARLSLEELRVDIPELGGSGGDSPDDFPDVDEDLPTAHKCPKCGYEFS